MAPTLHVAAARRGTELPEPKATVVVKRKMANIITINLSTAQKTIPAALANPPTARTLITTNVTTIIRTRQ